MIGNQYITTGLSKCTYCDRLIKMGDTFCPSCGNKVVIKRLLSNSTSNTGSTDSIATCRYTLHCQRSFKELSFRIENHIDVFKKDTPVLVKTSKFNASLRILHKKLELETRGVLLKYLNVWKKFEKATTDLQDYVVRTETSKQALQRRIEELENALEKVKTFREEERMGVNLMQSFWEKEKKILQDQFEAEHTARQHEMIKEITALAQEREKNYCRKIHEQKAAEIKAIEVAIIHRSKEEMELMAANIEMACKHKLERQMLISYDALSERQKVALTQQKDSVLHLEQQLTKREQELEHQLKIVEEQRKEIQTLQAHTLTQENTLRLQYESQLAHEREQVASLQQQLKLVQGKGLNIMYD